MDNVRIDITGDRQVGVRFEEFPDDLKAELRSEIDSLSMDLLGLVQARIPKKTGDLANKLRRRVFDDKNRVTGRVDFNSADAQDFRKAAALEYGSRGKPVKVQAHRMKLDHFWEQKLATPITVLTKAYQRTPNVAERAFERGALAAMQPEVLARLNAVVENAVRKANA